MYYATYNDSSSLCIQNSSVKERELKRLREPHRVANVSEKARKSKNLVARCRDYDYGAGLRYHIPSPYDQYILKTKTCLQTTVQAKISEMLRQQPGHRVA